VVYDHREAGEKMDQKDFSILVTVVNNPNLMAVINMILPNRQENRVTLVIEEGKTLTLQMLKKEMEKEEHKVTIVADVEEKELDGETVFISADGNRIHIKK
jgi:hypothetical protein